MDKYVLNRFIRLIRIGYNKYYIKHGILSGISYVLEFEEANMNRMRLLDELASNGAITIESLSDEKSTEDGDNSDFVEFLLQEHILVPEKELIPNMYYGLFTRQKNSPDRLKGNNDKKPRPLILTSSNVMADVVRFNMEGMNCNAEILVYNGQEIDLSEYAYTSIIYEFYAPDLFHRLNQAALQAQCPLQISYLDGSAAFISPVIIHNMTVCYNEMELQFEASITHASAYRAYKNDMREQANPIMPYPRHILSMLTFNALHLYFDFLVSGKLRTKDRAIIFDIENFRYDLVDLFPLPNCPACKAENKMTHDFL